MTKVNKDGAVKKRSKHKLPIPFIPVIDLALAEVNKELERIKLVTSLVKSASLSIDARLVKHKGKSPYLILNPSMDKNPDSSSMEGLKLHGNGQGQGASSSNQQASHGNHMVNVDGHDLSNGAQGPVRPNNI